MGAAISSGSLAGLVDEPLARYRVRQGSLSSHRASMRAGEIAVLERILRRDDLSEPEASTARSALAYEQRELLVEQAREALREGRPDARSRALAVARGQAQTVGSRIKGLLAAIAPRAAGGHPPPPGQRGDSRRSARAVPAGLGEPRPE